MQKTVSVEGVDYSLTTMTAGDALDIQESVIGTDPASSPKAIQRWTFAIVEKSLRDVADVRGIPWTHYQALITPALEVNGFKTKADEAPGEAQAGANPAA